MLLMMKTQIFEQAQGQLGYLRRNTNIFIDNETRGKQLKCRQTSARSCSQLLILLLRCASVRNLTNERNVLVSS